MDPHQDPLHFPHTKTRPIIHKQTNPKPQISFPTLFTSITNLTTKQPLKPLSLSILSGHRTMASPPSKSSDPIYYHLIPSPHPQNYVVLPYYYPADHRRSNRCRIISTVSILALAFVVYFLWPSDPGLKIVRLRLDHVRIHPLPRIAIDISLALSVKVRNVDLYSMDYSSLHVAVAYRGRELGHVKSDGGHVKAWRSSYVDAVLMLDGVEVFYDVVHLLEDLARGTVPLDTVTEVKGQLGLFFFKFPIESRVSCEVHVNTRNQTIAKQNCYLE